MRFRFPELRARHWRFLLGLTLGFLASVGVAAATSLGYFSGYQGIALDVYFWAQGRLRAPEVVIVAIDDAAFLRLKERQPLPRDYLAGVIRGLRKSGARLIGLDVDLQRATLPAGDRALAGAIRGAPGDPAGQVVVARRLAVVSASDGEIRYRPIRLYDPSLEAASGFAEVSKDDDGFLRRIPLAVPLPDGKSFPSFSLALLARLGGQDSGALARTLAGREPIELSLPEWDEARGRARGTSPLRFSLDDDWKINFIGPADSFLTIGSNAVYQIGLSNQPVALDNPFRDRIVLVGATFTESRDSFPTPHGIMQGVEIHANILHTLLTRRQIQPIAWGASLLLQFVLCLAISALFALVRPTRALIISFGIAALVVSGLLTLTTHHGTFWFDFLTPVLAIYASSILHDAVERRRIRRSFHQYVGREVADRIYSDERSLRGQRRTVSILFADLRDFTTLSEVMGAEQVAQQLNEYFPMVVESVGRYRGIIIDFFGDAVMAVYGAPLDNPDHAMDAVWTALQMQAGLDGLNAVWQARGLPTFRMGVGIHTGSVFAGNVGAPRRMKYTVVGDAVNVAARLEGLNKELQTTVLITGETYAAIGDKAKVKDCGELKVKGRHQAVKVYEVLGLVDSAEGPQGRLP
jgi:class 3 adenylate cyclase/CHASE2 domain-containing sensor protein